MEKNDSKNNIDQKCDITKANTDNNTYSDTVSERKYKLNEMKKTKDTNNQSISYPPAIPLFHRHHSLNSTIISSIIENNFRSKIFSIPLTNISFNRYFHPTDISTSTNISTSTDIS